MPKGKAETPKAKRGRTLMIVESPNKVKTLKSFLPPEYDVVASVGHIAGIRDGGEYWNTGICPSKGFEADYALLPDKAKRVGEIKAMAKAADRVVLASDPDREGEAIAWSLAKFLSIPKGKAVRCSFHEITRKAVLDALASPSSVDEDLVHAAHARQKLDKMLGYRLSPMARKAVGARSVGRCQSAGLRIICDREREIESFVPEEYGELRLTFEKGGRKMSAKYAPGDGKRPSYAECEAAMADCEGRPFAVEEAVRKPKTSNPKPPFTTSSYQQEAASKLGFSVKKAMTCAQRLFEGADVGGRHVAFVTYIRTDSSELSPEFVPALEAYVRAEYGEEYFAPVRKGRRQENAQEGHEAIRPVDLSMTPGKAQGLLKDDDLSKAYALIWARTVASAMAPARISETDYAIGCAGHRFEAVSKELAFDGFLRAYPFRDKASKDPLPALSVGEELEACSLAAERKSTQPPARYKEGTFVKELESTGIGRPSTYASIIQTLLDEGRGYCVERDGSMAPTEKGMALDSYLREKFPCLIGVEYTGEMEKGLDAIAEGREAEESFLRSFLDGMEKACSEAGEPAGKPQGPAPGIECPLCGGPMVLRSGRYGDFYGCASYPKCKGTRKMEGNGNGED